MGALIGNLVFAVLGFSGVALVVLAGIVGVVFVFRLIAGK
jgi:hypothetical protein